MSKEPSYIRCIKPNENKEPGEAGAEGSAVSKDGQRGLFGAGCVGCVCVYTETAWLSWQQIG